jgi:GTP-binding protein LepA
MTHYANNMSNHQSVMRNFCIVAHIDHGKSTLADCIIKRCGGLSDREMMHQVLDSLAIERKRGITIKAQTVQLLYTWDNIVYTLHLIDTPGHVDFAYEVSRSLAACDGVLLVVDASQGVEAQTLAVCQQAIAHRLTIIPVLNKIDLPQADPARVIAQIEDLLNIPAQDAIHISAKKDIGIDALLERIVVDIPYPTGKPTEPFQGLIIDAWFDVYWGVVLLIVVKSGCINVKDSIRVMSTNSVHDVIQLGVFTPKAQQRDTLMAGEVGYVMAGIKTIHSVPVGDTLVHKNCSNPIALPGFQLIQPMVYAGLYPIDGQDFPLLRDALNKLQLNDAALSYEPDTSTALGFGFRCGFLGMLHMNIIQERLESEHALNLILTAPSVRYRAFMTDGTQQWVETPAQLPPSQHLATLEEPIIETIIWLPHLYLGDVLKLCHERRGVQQTSHYADDRVKLMFHLPLAEVVLDFFDCVKSLTHGFGSVHFNTTHYQAAPLVRVDIRVNGDLVDALSCIVHNDKAYHEGRLLVEHLKETIPKQQFDIAIQAAIGGRIIARETVKALRKNVLAKCYGGDITRKRKLLEKQKEGKKRLKHIGNVAISQSAFLAILKRSS